MSCDGIDVDIPISIRYRDDGCTWGVEQIERSISVKLLDGRGEEKHPARSVSSSPTYPHLGVLLTSQYVYPELDVAQHEATIITEIPPFSSPQF